MFTTNFVNINTLNELPWLLQRRKNPARGPYRKKLNRSRASAKPIEFEDLGYRPAQMFEKKIHILIDVVYSASPSWLLRPQIIKLGNWFKRRT